MYCNIYTGGRVHLNDAIKPSLNDAMKPSFSKRTSTECSVHSYYHNTIQYVNILVLLIIGLIWFGIVWFGIVWYGFVIIVIRIQMYTNSLSIL